MPTKIEITPTGGVCFQSFYELMPVAYAMNYYSTLTGAYAEIADELVDQQAIHLNFNHTNFLNVVFHKHNVTDLFANQLVSIGC